MVDDRFLKRRREKIQKDRAWKKDRGDVTRCATVVGSPRAAHKINPEVEVPTSERELKNGGRTKDDDDSIHQFSNRRTSYYDKKEQNFNEVYTILYHTVSDDRDASAWLCLDNNNE